MRRRAKCHRHNQRSKRAGGRLMLECCVKHKATAVNGRWEYSEKELYELNLVGPIAIVDCPMCKREAILQHELLRKAFPQF